MCIFSGIFCDKKLSYEQYSSMTEWQSKQLRDKDQIISERDKTIRDFQERMQLQENRHAFEVSELKKQVEKLDWRRIRTHCMNVDDFPEENQ